MFRIAATILLLSSFAFAEAPDSTYMAVRLTGGAGIARSVVRGSDSASPKGMLGVGARVLAGPSSSPWRYGAMAQAYTSFTLFATPSTEARSIHLLVARELLPPPSMLTVSLLGGLGRTSSVERGKRITSTEGFTTRYESIEDSGPSLLLGCDLGVSLWRVAGLSASMQLRIDQVSQFLVLLQADVGRW